MSSGTDVNGSDVVSIWPSYHMSSILSIDCNSEGVLISGAESNDLCIWDAANRSLVHQLQGFPGEITALCFSKRNPTYFWAASDCMLLQFDLRNYSQSVHDMCYSDDDINMIIFNESESIMAICDDAGHVTTIDQKSRKKGILHSFADHDSCVSSIQFSHPHHTDPELLYSAGTDAQLRCWDLHSGTSSGLVHLNDCFNQSSDEQSAPENGDTIEQNVDNCETVITNPNILTPPMAHSISLNSSGSLLACGLENSALLIFNILHKDGQSVGASDTDTAAGYSNSSRSIQFRTSALLSGHTAGVCQVMFPKDWNQSTLGIDSEDILISGGSDKRIISWKRTYDSNQSAETSFNRNTGARGDLEEEPMDDVEVSNGESEAVLGSEFSSSSPLNFEKVRSISHHNKINWMCPAVVKGCSLLFVADLSSVVSSYSNQSLFVVS